MARFGLAIFGASLCWIVGLSFAASAPDANTGIQSSENAIIHTIPLQAQLLELNATLSELADVQCGEEKAHALLQRATEEAWQALQIISGRTMNEKKPEMIHFRRKLQAAGAQAGFFPMNFPGMFSTDLTSVIVDRIQAAAQQALKVREAAGKGLEDAVLDSLSPAGHDMLSRTRTTIAAEESLTNLLDQVVQNIQSQPGFAEYVKSMQGKREEVMPHLKYKGRSLKLSSGYDEVKSPPEIAQSLRNDLSEVFENLQSRFMGAINTAHESFQQHMLNLEDRFQTLRQRLKEDDAATKKRRLLWDADEELFEDVYNANNDTDTKDDAAEWTQEGILYWPPPVVHTNTIILMMQPQDTEDNAAFLEDVLGLLAETLQVSRPVVPIGDTKQILSDNETASTESDLLWWDKMENRSGNDDDLFSIQNRRLQQSNNQTGEVKQSRPAKLSGHSLDEVYNNEEWIWLDEDDDWLLTPRSNDEAVTSLAMSLLLPPEQGGLPPPLLEMLAESSMADLLERMSSAPPGGKIHIESSVPHFAVFGSSVLSNGQLGKNDKVQQMVDHFAKQQRSEVIVMPLGADTRAPMPHSVNDAPGSWDARWWGIGLAASAIGLLLAGTALAAFKATAKYPLSGIARDDPFTGATQNYHSLSNTPSNPWEGKGSRDQDGFKAKTIDAQGSALRKTSNLPA